MTLEEVLAANTLVSVEVSDYTEIPFGGVHVIGGSDDPITQIILHQGAQGPQGPQGPSGETGVSGPSGPVEEVTVRGTTPLVNGQSYIDVVFTDNTQPSSDWMLAELQVVNVVDSSPLNVAPGIITSKTTTGFRLQLIGLPDSSNYELHWGIIGPSSGTSLTTDFLNLTDTPDSYAGKSGNVVKVNAGETGLLFGVTASGSGRNDSFATQGVTYLVDGQNYIDVILPQTQPDGNWIFAGSIVNVLDGSPLNIWPGIMSVKSATGFRLQLSGAPDSSNYALHWGIGRKEATPGGGEEGVTLATDDFNRIDSSDLGDNWTPIDDGGLAILGSEAIGTLPGTGISGSYRTSEVFTPDQFSEIVITGSPAVSVGLLIRAGPGNVEYYGQYFWNSGAPFLQLYLRLPSASFGAIGSSFSCGVLAPGTRLRLMMVGNMLSFLVDGVEKLTYYDQASPGTSPPWITSGSPGIAIIGNTDTVEDWSGGAAGFEVHYLSTDPNGVESYHLISNKNGYGIHKLKVLRPTAPVGGLAHHYLYALPVAPEDDTTYGDGMETLRLLGMHNLYNVTIIQPSFAFYPWYPDHPTDPNFRYESFMVLELQPWVKANLATSETEQHWLLGFSKSGFGALTMMFRHPTFFDLAAAWDFPVESLVHYNSVGEQMAENYATDANFQDNYRITDAFLDVYKAPFQVDNRIHISGHNFWGVDVAAFDAQLTAKGVLHTYPTPVAAPVHSWNGGWVPAAVEGLYQLSLLL